MQKRIECKITDKVQMVMFRDFIKKSADDLCIVGVAQNTTDVPISAQVLDVLIWWISPTGKFSDFDIVW